MDGTLLVVGDMVNCVSEFIHLGGALIDPKQPLCLEYAVVSEQHWDHFSQMGSNCPGCHSPLRSRGGVPTRLQGHAAYQGSFLDASKMVKRHA
jgi:hypothetical protein